MPSLATWFTPSLQTFSRSAGRSSVLSAAYRACMKLTDERIGKTTDYTPKGKHGLAGNICIGIPNDDIGKLWNDAEKSETRVNSTVARELMVPLPSDWSDVERAKCARGLGEMLRARYGVAVLVSIHRPSKDNNNDHAHIMFTTRTVDMEGIFGKKTRILDDAKTGEVKKLREAVCEVVNAQAKEQGDDWYVYAGKFADVIEDHIPTNHISIAHGKKQKQYIDANREDVGQARIELGRIRNNVKSNSAKIAVLTAEQTIAESSQNGSPLQAKLVDGLLAIQTREQVLERLRSHPEMANYVDEAATNESLFQVLIEAESGIIQSSKEAEEFKKKSLSPIQMPAEAEKARLQIEKALFSRMTLRQQLTAWQDMRKNLMAKPPSPEYGFFGRPKAAYKEALAQYNQNLQTAKDGITECNTRENALLVYIENPEVQRLHNVYQEVMAHNAEVEAQKVEMAQQHELRRALIEQVQAQRQQRANRVDWVAHTCEPVGLVNDHATEYGSGGMGI